MATELYYEEQKALKEQYEAVKGRVEELSHLPENLADELTGLLKDTANNLANGCDSQEMNSAITTLRMVEILAQYGEELEKIAMTDAKTGAYSEEYFAARSENLLKNIDRGSTKSTSLIYIDIDQFKQFNEDYGHAGGDDALRYVVNTVKSALRDNDEMCRIGGDEFVVLCPGGDGEKIRDNIYQKLDTSTFRINGKDVPISVSVGATDIIKKDRIDIALDRADQDMFQQKEIRHRVLAARQTEMEDSTTKPEIE